MMIRTYHSHFQQPIISSQWKKYMEEDYSIAFARAYCNVDAQLDISMYSYIPRLVPSGHISASYSHLLTFSKFASGTDATRGSSVLSLPFESIYKYCPGSGSLFQGSVSVVTNLPTPPPKLQSRPRGVLSARYHTARQL